MARIGYHCSHERFAPSELLRLSRLAEELGLEAAMCSDHFHPWSEEQGQSGFAWPWLGAAMQATNLSFGMVCAPGQRYNPAIIAQAAATLAEMYPDRLWCSFGSGQFLNEHITGERWPTKRERMQRLRESVDVMRALWAGETVTHRGTFVVEEAKLYTLPQNAPLVLVAALSNETAEWAAGWADGIITVAKPREDQQRFVEAFHRGGGRGKPMYLQALHGWHRDEEQARQESWQQWRTNLFGSEIQSDLKMPSHFESVSRSVRPADMSDVYRISSNVADHIRWINEDIELGFERIFVHNAAANQEDFLRVFAAEVFPHLRRN